MEKRRQPKYPENFTMHRHRTLYWILFWTFYQYIHSLSVSGRIENDTTFFYRKIPTDSPLSSATIDYTVTFPIGLEYVNFGVYTTKDHINLQKRCTYHMYEQLGNKKMQTELDHHRNSCILSRDKLSCQSRIMVWDYRPRKFGFSFGFYCKDTRKSLRGLTHWRIQGGAPGTRAPPGVQIISFSCSFRQKCEK